MGVNYVVGQSVYKADPRHDPTREAPKKRHAFVGKEVIIAGGAFNSPQILKTSGVGPKAELQKFNITVIKDLPGVGERLGDNYEGTITSISPRDPDSLGAPYALYLNTSQSEGPRDIFFWNLKGAFDGFWPGCKQLHEFSYPFWMDPRPKTSALPPASFPPSSGHSSGPSGPRPK